MGELIGFLIIAGIVYYLFGEAKRKFDSAKNTLMGERGRCINCRYCVRDETHQFSSTDYFCRLSKCDHITEDTLMDCVEKPVITEEDLKEIFSENVLNAAGEQYVRTALLGKKMGITDLDAFFLQLFREHPEFARTHTDNAPVAAAGVETPNSWTCSCGRVNQNYVTGCVCGKTKRDLT